MAVLPEGFEALEPWVSDWALETTDERLRKRGVSSPDEVRAFHNAMLPHAQKALEYLNSKDICALDAEDTNLMKLILSLGHTAMAVEVQRTTHQPGVQYPHNIRVTHGLPLLG